ncbi:T9SS type A sorting domain-containing protein [Flavobacterium sp.]|uniref:T9SS type A sorting domain-containing protein n=1 Tax=Flavobacterium sp. TaxID=239 RepID=UPI0039E6A584
MRKLLLSLLLLCFVDGFAQSPTPPPLGANPWYALDMDNDGSAPFDIAYFISAIARPGLEIDTEQSMAGYDIWAEDDPEVPLTPIYYNTYNHQFISLTFEYNGNGPVFDPFLSPGWPFELFQLGGIFLDAIPYDGDFDNDGISNADEDLNGNGVLNDDNNGNPYFPNFMNPDDDGDGTPTIEEDYNGNGDPQDDDLNDNGIPDYLDPLVTPLSATKFVSKAFVLYPNPASDRLTVFVPNAKVASVEIIDATGRVVLNTNSVHPIDISPLASGNYSVKITTDAAQSVKKLMVE